MNIKPLGENILIKAEEEEKKEKTETGIYLPEASKSKEPLPQIGEVVAIGDSEKIVVKQGNRVVYSKYAGSEINVEDEKYLIVKNEDILAVIE